jgi:hypothetical protein
MQYMIDSVTGLIGKLHEYFGTALLERLRQGIVSATPVLVRMVGWTVGPF